MAKTPEKQPPTFAELRQQILDGGDVTPAAYERAKTLAELDELQKLADQRAAERQAAAQRLERLEQAKARFLGIAGGDGMAAAEARWRESEERLLEALAAHQALADTYNGAITALMSDLKAEGIRPDTQNAGPQDGDAGMSYREDITGRLGIIVDGIDYTPINVKRRPEAWRRRLRKAL